MSGRLPRDGEPHGAWFGRLDQDIEYLGDAFLRGIRRECDRELARRKREKRANPVTGRRRGRAIVNYGSGEE